MQLTCTQISFMRQTSLDPCSRRISSSDIKDKTNLTNARKAVERQMERFKVCEKETKTKAFSKEGLGQAAKLDPREKKRSDTREWLSAAVGKLNEDVSPNMAGPAACAHLPALHLCLLMPNRAARDLPHAYAVSLAVQCQRPLLLLCVAQSLADEHMN